MTPTTQDILVAAIRTNNATAWTAFVTGHQSMVYDLAHALAMCPSQYEELVGEGEVALCQSARAFVDGEFDCRFTTYGYQRIRRAMVSYQRTEGVSSEWMARICSKTRKDMDDLRDKFGSLGIDREPTPEELAYVSLAGDPSEEDVRRYEDRLRGTPKFIMLDPSVPNDEADEYIDAAFADALQPDTKHIWLGMMEQVQITGNASLSLEAERNDITRDEVLEQMCAALRQWASYYGTTQ